MLIILEIALGLMGLLLLIMGGGWIFSLKKNGRYRNFAARRSYLVSKFLKIPDCCHENTLAIGVDRGFSL
jgi:hypothetical protein|tara:strand:+ start:18129 stop:18338 length:210 start_codon:yes stop_codon:yes gene_type:complete